MAIEQEIEKKAQRINEMLEEYLPKEEGFQKTIFEAMNYSIRVGGKRLRPMLMEATYQMFGGAGKIIEPFMAAIEMIHTYSLVHDDLPAMDNDMYRRGKLTTHAVYGEAMGILAGDALLNYAYETAGKAFALATEQAKTASEEEGLVVYDRVIKAYNLLAECAGVYGMVGGQVVDVESDGEDAPEITKEKLDFIYDKKTGALLCASMGIGAILGGASREEINNILKVAKKVGLAFQIQDDILDVTSTLEVLGKPIGSDTKNNKATYVSFEGLEKAKEDEKRLSEEAVAELESIGKECSFLKELILFLIDRIK
ncbi:MAG: polyprenyl synthetase family protein [Agathobacter sp.]